MASQGSFSFEALDPHTRAVAEEAARAAGVTIEAWIARAILVQAGHAPAAPAASASTTGAASAPVSAEDAASGEPLSDEALLAAHNAFGHQVEIAPTTPVGAAEHPASVSLDAGKIATRTAATELGPVPATPPSVASALPSALPELAARARDIGRRILENRRARLSAIALLAIILGVTAGLVVAFNRGHDVRTENARLAGKTIGPSEGSSAGRATEPAPDTAAASPPADRGAVPAAPPAPLPAPGAEERGPAAPEAPTSAVMAPAPEAPPPATPPAAPDAAASAAAAPPQTASMPPPATPSEPVARASHSVRQLEARAKKGDARAQYDLAILYVRGDAVRQDYKQAAGWFRAAARQGFAGAQYNLGVLHEQGLGLEKNPRQAVLWYLKAAEQGFAPAEYNVGLAYAEGRGIPPNDGEARAWFAKAAEQGLAVAAFNLGVLYESDRGGGIDLAAAYNWYKIAVRNGNALADKYLNKLSANVDADVIAEGERRYAVAAVAIPLGPSLEPARPGATVAEPAKPLAAVAAPQAGPAASGERSSLVAQIQRRLGSLGYESGPPDGQFGAKTAAAIRSFQDDAGLPVDGKATPALLEEIKSISGKP